MDLNIKNMRFPWFRLSAIFFIPARLPGWIIFVGCVVYAVYSFIEIDGKSHSVSDTLMNFVFRMVIIFAGYTVIAFITSGAKSRTK